MSWKKYYKEHLLDMDALIRKIPSNCRVATSHAAGEPKAILHMMAKNKELYENVEILNILVMGDIPYAKTEMAGHLRYQTIFGTAGSRPGIAAGYNDYVPMYYTEMPKFMRESYRPKVAILHLTRPDEHGWCSMGVTVDYQRAALETADLVIAQLNDRMPRTYGENRVHITELSWFTEISETLPAMPEAGPASEVEKAIGRNCSTLIRNGDCLQLGIGSIPDALLSYMWDKKDLGIHSEMISDGVVSLVEAGIINNKCKNLDNGAMTATFAMGTQRLYDFLDRNPGVLMNPVDYTNNPRIICQQDNMVTINSCLQVDLFGQVAADTIGRRQFSGPGGQVDFVRGANMSRGGRNIIAMPSTAKGGTCSRITPLLPEGGCVTTNRFDVNYVVTEYGVAQLWGKTQAERAEALIAIAHPKFRDQLGTSLLS